MTRFQSVFAGHLAKYVRLRRRLGLRFVQQEGILHAFDLHAHARGHQGPLTEELARDFATAGRLRVLAATYSLTTGEVTWLDLLRAREAGDRHE